ncbi:hypothetical protein PRZ48_005063 [Zasmidium cellare]|uniref:Uncharacterized protein n=1 Tax=Zasmidium cellare TaxID=395010 RepID=A0ABR0ERI8_ZASCE|nr:hypothetical protein PRZ48_005063 [Zasmidium cellare]
MMHNKAQELAGLKKDMSFVEGMLMSLFIWLLTKLKLNDAYQRKLNSYDVPAVVEGIYDSIWAVPKAKEAAAVQRRTAIPPPAPMRDDVDLITQKTRDISLSDNKHQAVKETAEPPVPASAAEMSSTEGSLTPPPPARPAPKPGFNEEGLPVLFRPGATQEARAVADAMTKGGSSKKLPPPKKNIPAAPRQSVPAAGLTKVQSLAQRERDLCNKREAIKAKVAALQADIAEVKDLIKKTRQEKLVAIGKMTGQARKEAQRLYG